MLRARFWVESALAAVTVVWRDWIEIVFHVDPDRQSGSLEWAIVAALWIAAAGCALLARSELRLTRS